jgi:FAD/FMN-containing dehydrogenase
MPLSGGVVLSLAEMNAIKSIGPGRVVAGPGAVLAEIDRATRAHSGQELRMSPSTYNTASIGGFVAGGSGGIGSIRWGGLRDLGNVMRLRIVTMEAEPKVMELTGEDVLKVMHAYGTNGIITEVEMPLTASYDWVDVIVGFDDFMQAVRFGNDLGIQDGILVKLITPIAAPIPYDYFKRHQKYVRRDQSIVVLMIAPHAMDAFAAFTARSKGEIVFRADKEPDLKGLPPAYELTWNHTTLRAIRVDPTITYLQVRYPFPDHVDHIGRMAKRFGDELPGHVEYIRFDGSIGAAGLPLVRYTTEQRLDEIIRIHEDNGCWIFNPHRYTLEEGGMKQTDEVQLAFKRETDADGLLNPGKMIAWENPQYDYRTGKPFLFKGLQQAS